MKTIVVRGRVIRYEEGKEAEIFTLVLKGTVEEYWFKNSSLGKSYIEINENELDLILKNTSEVVHKEKEGISIDPMFRL